MKYYSIYDLVGVCVSDDYPWCDTLFLSCGVAQEGEAAFNACAQKIYVDFVKKLPMEDVRFIGDGAYIAAGTTVTKDVEPDSLSIARSRQENKPGWAKKRRELYGKK